MRSRDTIEDYGSGTSSSNNKKNNYSSRATTSNHPRNNSQSSFNPFEEDDDSGLFGGENDHQNSGGEKFASMQELLEDEKSRNSHSVLNTRRGGGRRRCCGGRRRNNGGMTAGGGANGKRSRRKKLCCLLLLLLLLGGIIGVILYFTLGKKNDTEKDGIKGSEMNTVPGEPPSPNGAPSRPNTPSVGEPVDGGAPTVGGTYPPNQAPTESPFSAKLDFTISFTKSPTVVGSSPPMESPKDVTWAPTTSTTTSSGSTVSGGSGIVAPTGPPNWILPQGEEVPTFPPQLNSVVEVPTKLPSLPTMSPMQELVFGNAGTLGPEPTDRPSTSNMPSSIGIATPTFMPNAMPSRGGLPTDIPTSSSMPSVMATLNGTLNDTTATPTTAPTYNGTTNATELTNATNKELACPDSSNPNLWTEMTLDEDDSVMFRYAIVLPEDSTTSTPSKEGGILCAHIESLSEAYLAIAISPSQTMSNAQAIIGLPDEGSVKKYWLNDGLGGVSDRGAYAMEEERQTLLFARIQQVEIEEVGPTNTGNLNDNSQVIVQEEVVEEDGSIEGGGGTTTTGGELNDAPTLEEVVEDGTAAVVGGEMTTTTQVPPRDDGEATVMEDTMDNRHMQELQQQQQQQQAEVGTTLQSSTTQIKTIMTFAKYLTEPEEHEILLSGTNAFLYSVGSSNNLGYHASRGSFTLDFEMALPAVDVVVGNETDVGDIMLNMTVNGTDTDNNETSYGENISNNNTQSSIVSSSITPMDYGAQTNDQCVEFCYAENQLSLLAPQVEEGSCSEMGYDSVIELNKIIIQEPAGGSSSSLDVPIRLNVDIYQAPIVPIATICNEGEVIVHALNEDATNYGASKSENNEQCVQSCLKDFLVNSNSPAKPRGFSEGSCEEMGFGTIVEGGNVVQPAGAIFPLTVDIFEKDMQPQAQAQQQQSSVCEENSVLVYALNADATNYGAINYNQCVESCLAQFIWLSSPQGVQEGSCAQQGFDELVQKDKVVEPEGFIFPLTVSVYDRKEEKEEEVVNQGRQCSEGFVLVHVANTLGDKNAGSVYQEEEDSDEPTMSPTILNGTVTPTSSSSSLSNISSPTLPPLSNAPAASPDSTPTYSPTSSPITNEFGSLNNETQPPILSTTTYAMLDQLSNPYTMSTTLEFDTQRSRYGSAVAISSTNGIVAVGARDGENENGVPTGAVYLYKLSDSESDDGGTNKLTLLQVLYGNAPKDQFGNAISMSSDGQRIIVGSRREDDQRGAARVYERRLDGGNGALEWVFMEDEGGIMMGEGSGARGGWSVAISPGGDVVALGSPKGGAEGGGSVQTFKYDSGLNKWQPFGSTIEGIREATGYSLSLGGGTDNGSYVMIVGSAKTSGNAGKISMYTIDDNSGGDWEPLGQEINGQTAGDTDGTSVAMSEDGTVVIVGGKGRNKLDTITGKEEISSVGYCRVYKYQQSSWELQHTIVGEVANERLGSSVGVSSDGNVVACGGVSGTHNYSNNSSGGDSGDPSASAAGAATISGVVRLYNMATQTESTLWPRGDAAIVDGSTFGSTVALSPDGGQVVVGAPEWTNPSVTKDDGPFAGAIQIFQVPA